MLDYRQDLHLLIDVLLSSVGKVLAVRFCLTLINADELNTPKSLFLVKVTPKLYTSVPQVLLTQY